MTVRNARLRLLRAVCRHLAGRNLTPASVAFYLVTRDWRSTPTGSGAMAVVDSRPVSTWYAEPKPAAPIPFITYRPDREGD